MNNKNIVLKAYAVIVTIAIITSFAWKCGYNAGRDDTVERVSDVLESEGRKSNLGGTFDAMCDEFAPEFE